MMYKKKWYLLLGVLIVILGEIVFVLFANTNSSINPFRKLQPSIINKTPTLPSNLAFGDYTVSSSNTTFSIRVKLLKIYKENDTIKANIGFNLQNGNGEYVIIPIILAKKQSFETPVLLQTQNVDSFNPKTGNLNEKNNLNNTVAFDQIIERLKPYINAVSFLNVTLDFPPPAKARLTSSTPYQAFLASNFPCNQQLLSYLDQSITKLSCIPYVYIIRIYVP